MMKMTTQNLSTKSVLSNQIINLKKQKNKIISEKNTQIEFLVTENNKLNNTLSTIEAQINQKNIQIDVINKALSGGEPPSSVIGNETTESSQLYKNDYNNTINETAKILGVTPKEITNSEGHINLTDSEKITLSIELQKNKTQVSSLENQKSELTYDITVNDNNVIKTTIITDQIINKYYKK